MKVRSACRAIAAVLMPPGPCASCGADSRGGPVPGICRSCWRKRRRPSRPGCPICSTPLPPVEGQVEGPCGLCLADPPRYEAHASAFVYEGPVRLLLLLYKDGGRYPFAAPLGRAVARTAALAWPDVRFDAVVPVPSPFRRRLLRGFEPAGLVAASAAREIGAPFKKLLGLRRGPKPQKGLSAAARRKNLAGAFRVKAAMAKGRTLLLVDDITTTGTTLREAAKALVRAGATVYAATAAMALKRGLDMG